jgi:methionyl aminopeptidase
MIRSKTEEEIEILRQSSLLVGKTLAEVAALIKPGVSALELDKVAEEFIKDHGAEPAFLGFNGFPNSLCCSVNEQVVHGIPTSKALESGDIISVDCGVYMNGYYGDSAYTFEVGEVSAEIRKLLKVTRECLTLGIAQAISGNRVGDIGFAIQEHAEKNGYGVVRELVGHGLGTSLHEAPEVPNYGRRGRGTKLVEGMTLAIEPMINLASREINQLDDGWTIITKDGKVSAHYEHDIVVRKGKAEMLSTFEYIEEVLSKKKEQV